MKEFSAKNSSNPEISHCGNQRRLEIVKKCELARREKMKKFGAKSSSNPEMSIFGNHGELKEFGAISSKISHCSNRR